MVPYIDWMIHCVTNDVCDACNAHTHGMNRYNHLDFQLVLNYPHQEIARILNTMGLRVQSGERFKPGTLSKAFMWIVRSDWMRLGSAEEMCCVLLFRTNTTGFRKKITAWNNIVSSCFLPMIFV